MNEEALTCDDFPGGRCCGSCHDDLDLIEIRRDGRLGIVCICLAHDLKADGWVSGELV